MTLLYQDLIGFGWFCRLQTCFTNLLTCTLTPVIQWFHLTLIVKDVDGYVSSPIVELLPGKSILNQLL